MKRFLLWVVGVILGVAVLLGAVMTVSYSFTGEGSRPAADTQFGGQAADWPEHGMAQLHALGFKTAAMALSDRSVSIDDNALAAEPKLAIVLGTEGDGLAEETIARCDHTVCIPMSHGVDSLNVAAASAVAFWELRYR